MKIETNIRTEEHTEKVTLSESELDVLIDRIGDIIVFELKEHNLKPTQIEILGNSTGVKGDRGLWGHTIVFGVKNACVTQQETGLSWELLKRIEQRISGENPLICRVLYQIP